MRRQEGYFINQSLIQMKNTITRFIVRAMTRKFNTSAQTISPQVLFYMGPTGTESLQKSYKYQPFNFFNYPSKVLDERLSDHSSEIILKLLFSPDNITKTVSGLSIPPADCKLIVFTVINTNDDEETTDLAIDLNGAANVIPNSNVTKPITNNAPNPPYINTNVMKKFINESKYLEKISNYIKSFQDPNDVQRLQTEYNTVKTTSQAAWDAVSNEFSLIISEYKFYRDDENFQKILNNGLYKFENIIPTMEAIRYLDTNNETTLIGTLNFMNFTTILNPDGLYPMVMDTNEYFDLKAI